MNDDIYIPTKDELLRMGFVFHDYGKTGHYSLDLNENIKITFFPGCPYFELCGGDGMVIPIVVQCESFLHTLISSIN